MIADVLVYFIYLHRYPLRHRFRIHDMCGITNPFFHIPATTLSIGLILTPCTATDPVRFVPGDPVRS